MRASATGAFEDFGATAVPVAEFGGAVVCFRGGDKFFVHAGQFAGFATAEDGLAGGAPRPAILPRRLGPYAANRQQIVDTFECAVGFARLKDFVRGRGPMPGTSCSSSDAAAFDVDGLN